MSTTFSKKSKNLIFSSDVTVFSLHEQHNTSVTYSLHLANAGSGGFSFDCPIGQSIGELSPCVPRFCYYERNCFVSTQSRTKSMFFWGKSGDFSFCIKFNSRYSQAFPFAFGWLYHNTGTLVCPYLFRTFVLACLFSFMCTDMRSFNMPDIAWFSQKAIHLTTLRGGRILAKCC